MSELIDISVPLRSSMPVWPGSPGFAITWIRRLERGDSTNATHLEMDVHVGTHVDAPLHFVPAGATVDAMPLDALVGPARVLDVGSAKEITANHLRGGIDGPERLLLRSTNSELWRTHPTAFHTDYAALTLDAAEWIVEQGIRLVGIDYLSIQRFQDGPETHQVLLRAGVVILEGLDLGHVAAGDYELIVLPLKLEGAEAAPARAVLKRISPLPRE